MSELPARLFLVVPAGLTPARAAACVARACAAGDVACVLVRRDARDMTARRGTASGEADAGIGAADAAAVRTVVAAAQEKGAAAVVEDDVKLARDAGADGVHVTGGARAAKAARRALGGEMIVGGEVRGRRHEAMELGEAGVDYVAIDQRQEAGGENLLAWWAEMFVVPAVAIVPARPADMATLARRGAGFVVPPEEMWRDTDAAARVVEACMTALREAA